MICLSFDIEEFDTPLEYGFQIPFEEQLEISTKGTARILELLAKNDVRATFFCTANFAQHRPEIVRRIVTEGHELASHSFYHSEFEPSHLVESRLALEQIAGVAIRGYRSPRMGKVDHQALLDAGYVYDSSVNPCWLPGRYNNLNEPRSIFKKGALVEIPSSVSALLRVPLFWLSVHNFPMWYLRCATSGALKRDGYLNIYLHPWEFTEECSMERYKMPFYIRRNSGDRLANRLDRLISHFLLKGCQFGTLSELVADKMTE